MPAVMQALAPAIYSPELQSLDPPAPILSPGTEGTASALLQHSSCLHSAPVPSTPAAHSEPGTQHANCLPQSARLSSHHGPSSSERLPCYTALTCGADVVPASCAHIAKLSTLEHPSLSKTWTPPSQAATPRPGQVSPLVPATGPSGNGNSKYEASAAAHGSLIVSTALILRKIIS